MKGLRLRKSWIVAGLLLAVLAVVLGACAHHFEWPDLFEDALEARGLWAALPLFIGGVVIGTLAMVPAWIFPLAAGAAFGFGWGLLASVVATAIATQVAFLVSRSALRERIERLAKRVPSFRKVDRAVEKAPFKVVALLRLSPLLPSGLKSYLLGLTCVRPATHAAATIVGTLPGTLLKVYLGSIGREALSSDSPAKWAMLAVGGAATVGLGWFLSRFARRQLGI